MKKNFITVLLFLFCFEMSTAQKPIIALSQAGYRPASTKMVTLVPKPGLDFPDSIPFYIHQAGFIPYAALNGYIGTTDDKPYLETSNAMGWNTQEIWDIPFQYAAGAAAFLSLEKK